jgi:hypothetical protein
MGITFRLRGFLGGSGTAMPPLDPRGDNAGLWGLLHDAANEIDRLEAEIATRALVNITATTHVAHDTVYLHRGDDGVVRYGIMRDDKLIWLNGWKIADDDRTPEEVRAWFEALIVDAARFAKIKLNDEAQEAQEAQEALAHEAFLAGHARPVANDSVDDAFGRWWSSRNGRSR